MITEDSSEILNALNDDLMCRWRYDNVDDLKEEYIALACEIKNEQEKFMLIDLIKNRISDFYLDTLKIWKN